eukprot:UN06929
MNVFEVDCREKLLFCDQATPNNIHIIQMPDAPMKSSNETNYGDLSKIQHRINFSENGQFNAPVKSYVHRDINLFDGIHEKLIFLDPEIQNDTLTNVIPNAPKKSLNDPRELTKIIEQRIDFRKMEEFRTPRKSFAPRNMKQFNDTPKKLIFCDPVSPSNARILQETPDTPMKSLYEKHDLSKVEKRIDFRQKMQMSAPTKDYSPRDVDQFYDIMKKIVNSDPKSPNNNFKLNEIPQTPEKSLYNTSDLSKVEMYLGILIYSMMFAKKLLFIDPDTEDSQLVYRNTQSATLGKNKYFYFKLKIIKSNNDKKQNNNDELKDKIVDNSNKEDLIITLTSKKGHADMYIDTKRSDPTRQQHIWHSATCDDKQTLILKSEQLKDVSWIYIGVHAYKEETEFSIFVDTQEIDNNELKRKTMNKGNSLVANDSGRKDDPNYQMCDTCGRYISKMSMTMHSMTCARRNWHCKLCNKSFEVKTKNNHIHCKQCDIICTSENNLKKHTELKHDVQPCPMCKQSVPAETLKYHMSDQCEMRMIACQWCSMQITQASKLKHEEHCASQV